MPVRTCLVTGEKREQHELLRFVVQDGKLVFESDEKKLPGRGGYVLPDLKTLEKLPKLQKKIAHFLHTPVHIDSAEVERGKICLDKKKTVPA